MPRINRTSDDPQDSVADTESPGRFPGWYLDPRNAEDERFWNGHAWTDLTRAAPRLDDFLGPIEPTLLALLGADDTGLETNGIVTDTNAASGAITDAVPQHASFRRVQEFMAN